MEREGQPVSDNADYGRIAPAPHRPENVPRSCWTCINQKGTMGESTICRRTGRIKNDLKPCDHYDLDAIWLMVDWFFPAKKR